MQNPELLLRPGMTATAEIVTTERRNALLVPNAALRWSPEREAAASRGQQGGATSVLIPRGGRGRGGRGGFGGGGPGREVSIGRGSRQTVYVLGPDGNPAPVSVVVGESNGSVTEVTGGDLREGQEVITARLAPGQTRTRARAAAGAKGAAAAAAAGGAAGRTAAPRPTRSSPRRRDSPRRRRRRGRDSPQGDSPRRHRPFKRDSPRGASRPMRRPQVRAVGRAGPAAACAGPAASASAT